MSGPQEAQEDPKTLRTGRQDQDPSCGRNTHSIPDMRIRIYPSTRAAMAVTGLGCQGPPGTILILGPVRIFFLGILKSSCFLFASAGRIFKPAPPSREDSVPEVKQLGYILSVTEIKHLGWKSKNHLSSSFFQIPSHSNQFLQAMNLLTSRVNPH